jgi:hypothetical protein
VELLIERKAGFPRSYLMIHGIDKGFAAPFFTKSFLLSVSNTAYKENAIENFE